MARLPRYFYALCNRAVNSTRWTFILQACHRQINSHASTRIRRLRASFEYYRQMFVDHSDLAALVQASLARVSRRMLRPLGRSLIAATAFSFHTESVADHELEHCTKVMERDFDILPTIEEIPGEGTSSTYENSGDWELLIDQPMFKLYRRPVVDSDYLYEYKCLGRYYDVRASTFFRAQIDNDYRKKWDDLIIELESVANDEHTGSEIVHWVSYFPFPMSPREYWFTRRACIDPCTKRMLIAQRSTDPTTHGLTVPDSKFVRVDIYNSTMLIKPHSTFDEFGVDFVLTYVDDPHAPFPTPAYKWLVKYGVPGYVQKVHDAALKLDQAKNKDEKNGA